MCLGKRDFFGACISNGGTLAVFVTMVFFGLASGFLGRTPAIACANKSSSDMMNPEYHAYVSFFSGRSQAKSSSH